MGSSAAIRGTVPRATRIEWLHNGSVVHSGTGSQLTIRISVNDSVHHNLYTCRGYRNLRVIGGFNLTTIVNGMYITVFDIHYCTCYNFMCTTIVSIYIYCSTTVVFFACAVPNTAILISTTAVSPASLSQSLRIDGIITETVDGLSASPVLQWLNHNGSDVVVGGGVILDGPNLQSTLTTLTLVFNALHTSHAGRYICQGSLTSPALFSPLVKTSDQNISVQSKPGGYAWVHTS